MSGAVLGRDDADAAIVALTAAYDRISAAMWALDGHPGARLLRDAGGAATAPPGAGSVGAGPPAGAGDQPGLTGHTRRYAADLADRVRALWSQFAALGAELDRVRAVRARRSRPGDEELRELTVLLRTPVVPVGADGLVPDDPAQPVARRLSLADLARHLEAASAAVSAQLSDLAAARSAVDDRFAAALAALGRLRAAAADLGPDGVPDDRLDLATTQLTEAYGEAAADPLALPEYGQGSAEADRRLRLVVAQLATLEAAARSTTALRDGYPGRADRLRAALTDLDEARRAADEACATARAKIARTALPAVPDPAPGLRAQLAQLDQVRRERRWHRLADELAAVERAVERAAERMAELRSAADGLLERRSELRGRLEAYRARAARLGFAEHPTLSELDGRVRDLLWAAPCDLPAATRALAAYQRHLNELSERGAA